MPGPYTDKKTAQRLLKQGLITQDQYAKLTGETISGALDLTSLGDLGSDQINQLVRSGSITQEDAQALGAQVGPRGNAVTRFLSQFNPLNESANRRIGPIEYNPSLLTLGLALASGGVGAGRAGAGMALRPAATRAGAASTAGAAQAVTQAARAAPRRVASAPSIRRPGSEDAFPTVIGPAQAVSQAAGAARRGTSTIKGRAIGAGVGAAVAGTTYGAIQANRSAGLEEQGQALAGALGPSAEEAQLGQAQNAIPAEAIPENAVVGEQQVTESGQPYRIVEIPGAGQFIQFAQDVFDPNTGEVLSLFGEAQRLSSTEDLQRERDLNEREFRLREQQARIAALPAITQFAQAFASPSMRIRTLAGAARLQEQLGGTSPFASIPGTSVPESLAGLFGLQAGGEVPLGGVNIRGQSQPISIQEAPGVSSSITTPINETTRMPQLTGVPNLAELSRLPAGEQDVLGELFNLYGIDPRDVESQFGQATGQQRRVRGLIGGR